MKNKIIYTLLLSLITISLCGCAAVTQGKVDTVEEIQEDTLEEEHENTAGAATDTQDTEEAEEGSSAPTVDLGLNVPKLSFNTVDVNGNPIDDSIIKDTKLVMVNFWEPWCGPCVGEMPDLEKLYEAYKDQGLLIIGAYSTTDMQEDVDAILSDCGTTYPIIVSDEGMYQFMTEYVPTTVFFNGDGYLLSEEPVIGSNDYENWSKTIESYLNQ